MVKRNLSGWLNIKIPESDKEILGKISVERDMSMSAICRQLIHEEVVRYEQKNQSYSR